MKELLLIRHGKSSWDHPGVSDHDRPLNERGLRDAPNVALALRQRGVKPDVILSSTANRARSTARLIGEELDFPDSDIVLIEDLYLASPTTIHSVVQQIDESAGTALLFGHNPGMHEATNQFAKDEWVEYFPTLAVARLEFPVDYWGEVEMDSAVLVESLSPRALSQD